MTPDSLEAALREDWTPVVGCEGRDDVSSADRGGSRVSRHGGAIRDEPLMMTQRRSDSGQCRVERWRSNGVTSACVHPRALAAWCRPCPSGREAAHVNGDPPENRLEPVAWGPPQEHRDPMGRHGTTPRGERHGHARVTTDDVIQSRHRRASGESVQRIARARGMHPMTAATRARKGACRHV